jgi:hypothetical protein
MNRRDFLGAAGAGAAVMNQAVGREFPDSSAKRLRIDLNGPWKKSVAKSFVRTIDVPSSQRPSGSYELSREIILPRLAKGEHAILHFEGITYFARVFSNDNELGSMDPYVPYEFDITGSVRERSNVISLQMADLGSQSDHTGTSQTELGVNPGWEAYGGIIRSVWIEIRPPSFINTAQFRYELTADFSSAQCRLRAEIVSGSPASGRIHVSLRHLGQIVISGAQAFSAQAGATEAEVPLKIVDPALWSPESPDLYDVLVSLETSGVVDELSFRTGFRQFRVAGSSFQLNGRDVLLNGVCRHDMWKEQGFTLTRDQMRHDMSAIKAMSFNFVRLVHYPHDRYVVELADELGLLVSEEPGYWNVDFHTMRTPVKDLGLRIIEKTIRRDWNSPSVIAWLVANECNLTVDYLNEAKALCRRVDPLARLVSAANSMPKEKAKPVFEQSGMDFFDDHPYTFDVSEFRKISEFYGNGRPLMFTEWGGKEIGQQSQVMSRTVDALIELQKSNRLAGTVFWSWQDLPQFSRIDAEMRNGILESGVVTQAREPREPVVMELRRLCEQRPSEESNPAVPEILPLKRAPWSPSKAVKSIDLSASVRDSGQIAAWQDFEGILAEHWRKTPYGEDQWSRTGRKFRLWKDSQIDLLGVRFQIPIVEGCVRPVVLTPAHPEITCPIGLRCSGLHVLGHISCPDGYPALGEPGSLAATLRINLQEVSPEIIPLRHGYEIARGNMIYLCSRLDPVTSNAQRALRFVKDTAREVYQILLFSVPVKGQVQSVTYRLQDGAQPLLIFAINAEAS